MQVKTWQNPLGNLIFVLYTTEFAEEFDVFNWSQSIKQRHILFRIGQEVLSLESERFENVNSESCSASWMHMRLASKGW